MRFRFFCIIAAIYFMSQGGYADSSEDAATDLVLSVDLNKRSAKPVAPTMFGANLLFWIDDDESLATEEIRAAIKAAGIRLLRFPGGTVADNYLWKENRLSRNDRFPYEDGPPKTDWREFLAYAESVGAEPILVVNTETFVREGRVEEGAAYAAEWVRAVAASGYTVSRWEIGNETYWHEVMGAREYAAVVRVYAEAMRAANPDIKLGVNGHWSTNMVGDRDRIHPEALVKITAANKSYSESTGKKEYVALVKSNQEPDIMTGDPKWWPTVIQECGDRIDFLVVHCYYHHSSQLRDLDLNLRAIRKLYKSIWPERDIELAMTEYNTVATYRSGPKPYLCGLADGLIAMLRAEVETACFWPLRIDGYWGKVGLINRETHTLQTGVPVLRLFSETIGKTTVPVDGKRGQLMSVAAFDAGSFNVYCSDYGLKTARSIRLELPPEWRADSVQVFSEKGSGLADEEAEFVQHGCTVQFTMSPGKVVNVQGVVR